MSLNGLVVTLENSFHRYTFSGRALVFHYGMVRGDALLLVLPSAFGQVRALPLPERLILLSRSEYHESVTTFPVGQLGTLEISLPPRVFQQAGGVWGCLVITFICVTVRFG